MSLWYIVQGFLVELAHSGPQEETGQKSGLIPRALTGLDDLIWAHTVLIPGFICVETEKSVSCQMNTIKFKFLTAKTMQFQIYSNRFCRMNVGLILKHGL